MSNRHTLITPEANKIYNEKLKIRKKERSFKKKEVKGLSQRENSPKKITIKSILKLRSLITIKCSSAISA